MKTTPTRPAARTAPRTIGDIAAMFGEYAALAQHPGEDSDRLALAIRVMEALRLEEQQPAAQAPTQ